MQLSYVLSGFTLATTTLANPTLNDNHAKARRQLETVNAVVADVSGALSQLDGSVQAFAGDPAQIEADSANLLGVLDAGVATIQASNDLSLAEALGLQGSVAELQTAADGLVSSLGTQVAAFEQAGLCGTVEAAVSDVSASSQTLIDEVVGKVPAAAQGIASGVTAGLTDSLNQGVALFANGACVNAA